PVELPAHDVLFNPRIRNRVDGSLRQAKSTNLFIHPEDGFDFRFTDLLMTNFHLPQSTLLALVAALQGIGLDRLMQVYTQAVAERYRFYSYGDAMLIV
ncbi:MAG: S-adenosylmethionine:tRNA ribosyltransferase-isomerase, partial [Planctomycetota bacterium]